MFSILLVFITGLALSLTVNSDYIAYSTPPGQPDGFTPYVLIEQPISGGRGNHDRFGYNMDANEQMANDELKPGEVRCPVDGDPHCRDCVAGHWDDNLVLTQCCFSHHWAWKNNRNLRDILPYRFHLSPVNQTEPYRDRYATAGEIWHVDVCTNEPIATLPEGGYIPCRRRSACPDVRADGTINEDSLFWQP
ncbi:uncharacterized protein LOC129602115 [Paramacrobiotus metropolitanus]|uniref:uncharacterized protein LOC129602115 n=1 Tax=Paramacrobiotus metropolitanus TaxID=2943436 RepID=UPI002445C951|nr:uncharacterized protein LOC129602115 [Paramacrobiotus metropolitanus]